MNGWTHLNSALRIQIIKYIQPDILSINETHAIDNSITIPGYKIYQFNRPKSGKATRGYGGVALAFRCEYLENKSLEITSRTIDGILGITIHDLVDNTKLIVYSVYMPPENSVKGRNCDEILGHLLGELYKHSNEHVIILGDFNAKTGMLQDINLEKGPHMNIKDRTGYDTTVNSHGKCLLEFMEDSRCCELMGRGLHASNATCISTRGKSHIDYIIVPYDTYPHMSNSKIIDVVELVQKLKAYDHLGPHCKLPDHNLICTNFISDSYINLWHTLENVNHSTDTEVEQTKLKINRNPRRDVLNDPVVLNSIKERIVEIENNIFNQQVVNECYEELTEILLEITDCKYTNCKSYRKHTPYRPYWTKELEHKWHSMHKIHVQFKRSKGKLDRNIILMQYKFLRKEFDKELRKAKRDHSRTIVDKLTKYVCRNPNKYWNIVNQLGPKRSRDIDMCVKQNNVIVYSTDLAMLNWYNKYDNLYNIREMHGLETVNRDPTDEYKDHILNLPITKHEVDKVVSSSKEGKGVGCDNLCNEVLKLPEMSNIMVKLFNIVYDTGVIPDQWRQTLISPIPKGNKSVPTDPLSYRGLSLQCCMYKLYSKILNERYMSHMENLGEFCENQNGFRKHRSTNEHIFTLCNTIRLNKVLNKNSTFACFVDFFKAFDRIDRHLLLE